MTSTIKATNIYNSVARAYCGDSDNVFKADFYGWHLDGNKPVYRMQVGTMKRSYIDICVDTCYLLCDSNDLELFNKLVENFKMCCDVKLLAFRKKSNQYVARLSNLGLGNLIDVTATTSIYKLPIEETKRAVKKGGRRRKVV